MYGEQCAESGDDKMTNQNPCVMLKNGVMTEEGKRTLGGRKMYHAPYCITQGGITHDSRKGNERRRVGRTVTSTYPSCFTLDYGKENARMGRSKGQEKRKREWEGMKTTTDTLPLIKEKERK